MVKMELKRWNTLIDKLPAPRTSIKTNSPTRMNNKLQLQQSLPVRRPFFSKIRLNQFSYVSLTMEIVSVSSKSIIREHPKYLHIKFNMWSLKTIWQEQNLEKIFLIKIGFLVPSTLAQSVNFKFRRIILNFESSPRVIFNEWINFERRRIWRINVQEYRGIGNYLYLDCYGAEGCIRQEVCWLFKRKKLVVERAKPLDIITRWRTVWNETNSSIAHEYGLQTTTNNRKMRNTYQRNYY